MTKARRPTALLDLDGVLVDNVAFDHEVTAFVVAALASDRGVNELEGRRLWESELAATRGDPQWYDYEHHCARLGLSGDVARSAHDEALPALRIVAGATSTLEHIRERGYDVAIVTDAVRWVAQLKLSTFGHVPIDTIFSSDSQASAKSSLRYWKTIRSRHDIEPVCLVDNRRENLASAVSALSGIPVVEFHMDEHVTTLSDAIAPRDSDRSRPSAVGNDRSSVSNHHELRCWLSRVLPRLQVSA
ncbi:MAG: 5-nucleotidase [Acidimicrobiaceae bacterium]